MKALSTHYNRSALVILNNKQGVFSDNQLRKAFQNILYQKSFEHKNKESMDAVPDFQFYYQGQKGRLTKNEAQNIIFEGKEFVEKLRSIIEKQPLRVLVPSKKTQVKIILDCFPNSIIIDSSNVKQFLDNNFNINDFDVSIGSIGRVGDDPDVIYSILGKYGALSYPTLYREKVADLLEIGREIIDENLIDCHYKEVNRTILREVPCVHLAHVSAQTLYNPKRLKISRQNLTKYGIYSLQSFESKFNYKVWHQQRLLPYNIALSFLVVLVQCLIFYFFSGLSLLVAMLITILLTIGGFIKLQSFMSNLVNNALIEPLKDLDQIDTELHIPELEIARQKQKAFVKRAEDREKMAAMAQTTTMLAHDVRKPFSLVKSVLDSWEFFRHDETALSMAKQEIEQSLKTVHSMINDILDYSREVKLITKPVSLSDLIERAVKLVFSDNKSDKITIHYDWQATLNPLIDEDRIMRVFNNIINNSVEAITVMGKKDKGNIFIKTTDSVDLDRKMIDVSIANDGPVFENGIENRLFQNLFTQGKAKGTGLGLASAKKIVSLHNGYISAKNLTNNQGVEFIIRLPASDVSI